MARTLHRDECPFCNYTFDCQCFSYGDMQKVERQRSLAHDTIEALADRVERDAELIEMYKTMLAGLKIVEIVEDRE